MAAEGSFPTLPNGKPSSLPRLCVEAMKPEVPGPSSPWQPAEEGAPEGEPRRSDRASPRALCRFRVLLHELLQEHEMSVRRAAAGGVMVAESELAVVKPLAYRSSILSSASMEGVFSSENVDMGSVLVDDIDGWSTNSREVISPIAMKFGDPMEDFATEVVRRPRLRLEWLKYRDIATRATPEIQMRSRPKKFYGGGDMRSTLSLLGADSKVWMLHPQGTARFVWDLLSLVILIFELITVPLSVCVLSDDINQIFATAFVFTTIFWTVDIFMSLRTGIYCDGSLMFDSKVVAKDYLSTWFIIDAFCVFPEWVALMMGAGSAHLLVFRVLKTARILRLARLVKMERVVNAVELRMNSNLAHNAMGICKLVLAIMFLNHLIACLWFKLGTVDDFGWHYHFFPDDYDRTYGYMTSLHWSVTQFQGSMEVYPRTTLERTFAVAMCFLALVGFSAFVSSFTEMLIQLQKMKKDQHTQAYVLRQFLRRHEISSVLSVAVKYRLQAKMEEKYGGEAEAAMLAMLPKGMQVELMNEIRSPILTTQAFFEHVQQNYRRVATNFFAEDVESLHCHDRDVLFESGDDCSRMLFVEHGVFTYDIDPNFSHIIGEDIFSRVKMRKCDWVCEAALWLAWQNTGNMMCLVTGTLLSVEPKKLANAVQRVENCYFDTCAYAQRFLEHANAATLVTDTGMHMRTGAESATRPSRQSFGAAFGWPA